MLIHGDNDGFVPFEMSREIYGAATDAELHSFAGATHAMSYMTDIGRYERITEEFLTKILGGDMSQNI